jgi:cytochrome c biogenesis protein CcmG, thiol:disulfide interchange protein DsbE
VRSTRAAIAALTLVAALAGCGDDDDESATTEPSGPAATTPGSVPPAATVSPDLPPEFTGEVGPVEVRGESLPALGSDTAVGDDPAVGLAAPVVIGANFDGAPIRIDAASDGPTMAVFLAHWCPHCNAEVPRLNELRDDARFPTGLDIIGVSTAPNPGRPNYPPSEWFEEMDWTYPVLVDGIDVDQGTFIAADAFGLDAFPFIALIDGSGKVTARWSGEREPDEVIEMIEQYLPEL